ncbi:unnamed protein product [Rhizophagus irregularis]|nr:unnamed protein product [Rhizophagus irregularis]
MHGKILKTCGSGDDKKDKGVVLPTTLKEGVNGKKLLVKVDENTRKYLDLQGQERWSILNYRNNFFFLAIIIDVNYCLSELYKLKLDKSALLSVIIVVEDMTKSQDRRDLPPSINSQAKAEKERKRSHGRVIRERERERERERDRDRDRDWQYGHYHQPRNNADKLKEKLKRKWLLNRERRWQHYREETMATNREREAERDLDVREKQIRDREIMAITEKERKQREDAMEVELNNEKEILTLATNGASQNNSVKPKLTLNHVARH